MEINYETLLYDVKVDRKEKTITGILKLNITITVDRINKLKEHLKKYCDIANCEIILKTKNY